MTLVEAASLRITNVHVSDTGNKKVLSSLRVEKIIRKQRVNGQKCKFILFDIKEITHVKWSGEVNPCILYINW